MTTKHNPTTYRIAICDDEQSARGDLRERVEGILPAADIALFSSGDALLANDLFFDVILLDIGMEGQNGLQTASALRKRQEKEGTGQSVIIFITGYEQFMADAFDVQAFHYLLKPVRDDKLREVLLRALKEVTRIAKRKPRFILLKAAGASQNVAVDEIRYLESSNKKVIVHLSDGATIETYRKMEEMETLLGGGFYRCHRCYLVNMDAIRAYNAEEITVTGGERIFVAQRKYSAFVKAYLRHLTGRTKGAGDATA